jgi:hypothetical protein
MMNLHRGSYTGQFGFLMIDGKNDPGRYDQEVFLALREWEPYLTTMDQDDMAADPNDPMPDSLSNHFPTLRKIAEGGDFYCTGSAGTITNTARPRRPNLAKKSSTASRVCTSH